MNNIMRLHLVFKNLSNDKTIVFMKDDKGTFIIRFCDIDIINYYPLEDINKKSIAPLEYISNRNDKSILISIPEKCNRIQFSNISYDNMQVKRLGIDNTSSTFIIGENINTFKDDEIIKKGEYSDLYNFNLPGEQFINYKLDREWLEIIKEKRDIKIKTDTIIDYYTFDSFEDFMDIMNLIKRKYNDINIRICNYNDICLNSFNYIEVHLLSRYRIQTIELRLGYKNRKEDK